MPTYIIDTMKQKNNGQFPVFVSNDGQGGYYQVSTLAERDAIPAARKLKGMLCNVTEDANGVYLYQWYGDKWDIPNFSSRTKVFLTIADRNAYPATSLFTGFSCLVVETNTHFFYRDDKQWQEMSGNAQIHIGVDPPEDKTMIWIKPDDEYTVGGIGNDMAAQFSQSISELNTKINDIHYALRYTLDAGYFTGYREDPDAMDPENPLPNPEGNIQHILLKRGKKIDLKSLFQAELGWCEDTEELFIGNQGKLRLIGKVGGIGGGGGGGGEEDPDVPANLTLYNLDLTNKKTGAVFRFEADEEGNLVGYNMIIDDGEPADPTTAASYRRKLIINQVYGAGLNNDTDDTPVSHSFIELYNNSSSDINLKGFYLYYGVNQGQWQKFALRGIIKSRHSHLVRCTRRSDPLIAMTKLKITKFDQEWNIRMADNGFKVYLAIGDQDPNAIPANPYQLDAGGAITTPGYVDLVGFGGLPVGEYLPPIDAWEGKSIYGQWVSKNHAIHRIDFADKDNNFTDCEQLDYRTVSASVYGPRCSKDGKWDSYYNKIKLNANAPNMINMGFGQDGATTRCWCWQTVPTVLGYLRYRKKVSAMTEVNDWIYIDSKKSEQAHDDGPVTIHHVTVHNLEPGDYEYQAGEEGKWSDIYTFQIRTPIGITDSFKFLQTSDQQGFTEREYRDWEVTARCITKFENGWGLDSYDFHINTGDISQNSNKAYEWRYYYAFAKDMLSSTVHMVTCGNNDCVKPAPGDPTPFTYYFNNENAIQDLPAVYSFDYGYAHFICLNSNFAKGTARITAQAEWLERDLQACKAAGGKRWVIVYIHDSPFTIRRDSATVAYDKIFSKWGVNLVICGHKHTYLRSKCMWVDEANPEGIEDNDRGTYYIMCHASGYKLSGKDAPNNDSKRWTADSAPGQTTSITPNNPSYMMWTVGYDSIYEEAYQLKGLTPLETCVEENITRERYDHFTLPWRINGTQTS